MAENIRRITPLELYPDGAVRVARFACDNADAALFMFLELNRGKTIVAEGDGLRCVLERDRDGWIHKTVTGENTFSESYRNSDEFLKQYGLRLGDESIPGD